MQYRKKKKKDFPDLEAHVFTWALLALLADTTETNLENMKSCYIPYCLHSNEQELSLG